MTGPRLFLGLVLVLGCALWWGVRPVATPPMATLATPPWPCGSRSKGAVIPEDVSKFNTGGAISIVMPQRRDTSDPRPRGGSYVHGGDVANLNSRTVDVLQVTWFDAACDAVVVDGAPLDGFTAPAGVVLTAWQNTSVILFAPDGGVVLRGVPPALWQVGAASQIHGTAADDLLSGSEADDVIWPGAGRDQVAPGGGDDYIGYTSGDLVILNDPPDLGHDRLDLRRFRADQIAVHADTEALILTTPDGTIRLTGQGSAAGNIEAVLLADDAVLDAAALTAMVR